MYVCMYVCMYSVSKTLYPCQSTFLTYKFWICCVCILKVLVSNLGLQTIYCDRSFTWFASVLFKYTFGSTNALLCIVEVQGSNLSLHTVYHDKAFFIMFSLSSWGNWGVWRCSIHKQINCTNEISFMYKPSITQSLVNMLS